MTVFEQIIDVLVIGSCNDEYLMVIDIVKILANLYFRFGTEHVFRKQTRRLPRQDSNRVRLGEPN